MVLPARPEVIAPKFGEPVRYSVAGAGGTGAGAGTVAALGSSRVLNTPFSSTNPCSRLFESM
jgi:hypothetical protein